MVDSGGVPKGLKQILGERCLWIEKLKKDCKARDVSLTGSPDCCTKHNALILGACYEGELKITHY